MPLFEQLNQNYIFECSDNLHVWWQITDKSIQLCKDEIKAYIKAKHTSIQKSYIFADPMYIFSENGSKKQKQTLKQTSKSKPSKF